MFQRLIGILVKKGILECPLTIQVLFAPEQFATIIYQSDEYPFERGSVSDFYLVFTMQASVFLKSNEDGHWIKCKKVTHYAKCLRLMYIKKCAFRYVYHGHFESQQVIVFGSV